MRLALAGVPLPMIQQLLGHTDPRRIAGTVVRSTIAIVSAHSSDARAPHVDIVWIIATSRVGHADVAAAGGCALRVSSVLRVGGGIALMGGTAARAGDRVAGGHG
jgi:hypothetical protein